MTESYCYINDKNPLFAQTAKYKEKNPYSFLVKIELFVLSLIIIVFTMSFYPLFSNAKSSELAAIIPQEENVLGAQTQVSETLPPETPAPSPTPILEPSLSPTPTPTTAPTKRARKNSYTIAVYGDSMIDTMGEKLEYLEHALTAMYPGVQFNLYNYGEGSQNVEMGLAKWNSGLNYKDRHYPAITGINPDIIILGSFAYNPFTPYDRDRHWLGLTHLIEEAKKITPNVYVMAEIAPLRKNFGKGPNGVNWDESTAFTHSGHIVEQLENAVGLANTLHTRLIDVYHASQGNATYVNPSDGIHPSASGHEFTANKIVNTLTL